MKYLIFFILLFSYNEAQAQSSLIVGTGGLTPHFSYTKKNYCNQWNNTGIIANKSYYLRLQGPVHGLTYMQGNDSICSEISGIFYHYVFTRASWYEAGISVGGYEFNMQNWKRHKERTPSEVKAPSPVHTRLGDRHIVPVLALQFDMHLIRRESWSLKLNNLLTPIVTNHSIALEFPF